MGASIVIDTLNGLSYLSAIPTRNVTSNTNIGPIDILNYLGVITFPVSVGAGGQGTLNFNVLGSETNNVSNAAAVNTVQAFTAFNNANAGISTIAVDTRVAPRYLWFQPQITGANANYTLSAVGVGQQKVES